MLSIRLLGPFQVLLDGHSAAKFDSDKVRALLAYLAVEANRPHRRQALAGLLWPDSTETAARANLRRALSNLRTVIGDRLTSEPAIIVTRQTIQFAEGRHIWVDVSVFRQLASRELFFAAAEPSSGTVAGTVKRPATADGLEGDEIEHLAEAAAAYYGPFLEGFSLSDNFAFEEWLVLKREQLRHQYLTILNKLAAYYEAAEAYELAMHYVRRQVALEPWSESTQRRLMRLLAYTGQRTAALDAFMDHKRTLAADLGIEPEAATIQLMQQIEEGKLGNRGVSKKEDGDGTGSPSLQIAPLTIPAASGLEHELDRLGSIPALARRLAQRYQRAGQKQKAIAYYHQAGNRAVRLSAHEEAISDFNQALALLKTMPDSAERTRQEIELSLALGVPLLSLKGYTDPAVQDIYDRARLLCQDIEAGPELGMALFWLASYYSTRGELETGLGLAQRMLDVAEKIGADELHIVLAQVMIGLPLFHMGRFNEAQLHFQQAAAAYNPVKHQALAYRIGQDPGIASLIWQGHTNIHLGNLDQAQQLFTEAMGATGRLDHALTLAFTLLMAGLTPSLYFRRTETAALYLQSMIDVANKEGFGYFQMMSLFYRGLDKAQRALIQGGRQTATQIEEGISQMQQALALERANGCPLGMSSRLIQLATVQRQVMQVNDGLRVLDEAQNLIDKNGARYIEPDLHRVKGELLGLDAHSPAQIEAAEQSCWRAIELARQQQARFLELRATVSLCRIWQKQGKYAAAHELLAAIHGWFSEGFDMPDMQEARELLAELH